VCAGEIPFTGALGLYPGAADPTGAARFQFGTEHDLTLASDYFQGDRGWAGLSDPGHLTWLLDRNGPHRDHDVAHSQPVVPERE
jgi:hypothetical protein